MEVPRVVMFAPVFPPRKGGSATYFSNLADILAGEVDITVVCLMDGRVPSSGWENNIRVIRTLPDEYGSHPVRRYLRVLPAAFNVLKTLKKEGDFILQAHSNGIYGFSASLFSAVHGIPMIKEVQDTSDPPWNLKLGNVKRWVSCGDHVRERLMENGMPSEKIKAFTIRNPPELDHLIREMKGNVERDHDRISMVYVGWLMNRVKGVDDLIEAFRMACAERDDLELIIIGDGPDRSFLEKRSTGLPVRFLGELDHRDVVRELLRSDFTVMASHEEAAGRIYTEGYAAGLPAIGTSVGGTPEVLINNRTGILVNDGDRIGMRDAILKMASDRGLRERLSKGGRELLDNIGGWEPLREWYMETYGLLWNDIRNGSR